MVTSRILPYLGRLARTSARPPRFFIPRPLINPMAITLLNGEIVLWEGLERHLGDLKVGDYFMYVHGDASPYRVLLGPHKHEYFRELVSDVICLQDGSLWRTPTTRKVV